MIQSTLNRNYRRLTTPRSAALAGILFALLFATSLTLLRISIPAGLSTDTTWLTTDRNYITFALGLTPFAGITYLWFIGVVRDRLGEYEDRFIASVFYGSSLLFLAMVFVSMAIMGSMVAAYRLNPEIEANGQVIYFGRALIIQLNNVYAVRMAGVTMMSLATIWLRTGLGPRWLTFLSFALALAMLLVINFSLWVTLIYPAWVMLISLFILWMRYKHPERQLTASE
ncbi:MAG: hypothetical protein H6666_18085 [Ardenticatenaceae bacterium]|nr:hypothetical protein [Anaerolineales bacterium]MCB8919827.1 hypothetical protein [Ardenticatenaceae bacterium]